MTWSKNAAKCFGLEDNIFAGHPIEIGVANEVLKEALNSGVSSWNEFCEPFEKACQPTRLKSR